MIDKALFGEQLELLPGSVLDFELGLIETLRITLSFD